MWTRSDLVSSLPVRRVQPRVASVPWWELPLGPHRLFAESTRQPPTEDVRRQIASSHPAERTIGDDPGVRHGLHWGRDVLAAALAADRIVANADAGRFHMRPSIGEKRRNLSTRCGELASPA